MLIRFDIQDWLIGIGILVILLPFVWRRKHNGPTLLFFSIFWVYLLAVIQAVVFPFAVDTQSVGAVFKPSINWIPFYFGSCALMPGLCIRGILENILLTVPFGFGIHFLVQVKPRRLLWLSIRIGLGLELVQLVISLIFKSGFRATDINDAIFNAAGILLGYALIRLFAWAYLKISLRFTLKPNGLLAEIQAVALRVQESEGSIDKTSNRL